LTLSYPPTSHRVSVAGVARSYDANGNTTARGSESLFYGDHNRLVTWSGAFGMSSASYQHNARGERVWKQSMAGAASMGGDKLPPECLAVQGLILQSFLYDEAGRVAVELRDLGSPPGNRLEALRGDRNGQHSIRINQQFRICFVWTTDGPVDVEIVD
jgi:proteic killer suppression protein